MTRKLQNFIWAGLLAGALSGSVAHAQENAQPAQQPQTQAPEQPTGPIPAYRSPLASVANNDDESDNDIQRLTTDNRALAGAQYLSLGVPTTRSYWQPRFNISGTADSNALETANSAGWAGWASVSAGVDLHRNGENNNLTLGYTSGGTFSNSTATRNGVVQSLNLVDKVTFRRSSVTFLDNLNYLPESSLGYGGLGGVSLPGGSPFGLGPGFAAGQANLTGRGQNLGNSFATELDTSLTPRSSLTFVGGYSLLHYFDSSLFNYGEYIFRGGYNHQLTPKDTVAVLYTFDGIRFGNSSQSIDEHTGQVSYGRTVTGRLAFQASAGPQVVISRIPITGNNGSAIPSGSTTRISWSLNTALQWQAQRTGLGLTYNHGVGGGYGVLAGSLNDTVTGSVTRKVTRAFSDALNAGYSRNDGAAITNRTAQNARFDYWFAGANLTHPVGQSLGLTLSYQMQYQTSNSTFCVGPTCGMNVIRHMISFGIAWQERPLLF